MNKPVPAPRVLSARDLAAVTARVNSLSSLQVNLTIGNTKQRTGLRVVGSSAVLDIDLTGISIDGYAPANADVLEGLSDTGGVLHYNGQPIGANGLTQADLAWSSSVSVSFNGAKVRRLYLAGNTAITFTDLAAARECLLIIHGGASPYSLTWQTGIVWPEEGVGPAIMPTGGVMVLHIYCAGPAATDIIATRNGGT